MRAGARCDGAAAAGPHAPPNWFSPPAPPKPAGFFFLGGGGRHETLSFAARAGIFFPLWQVFAAEDTTLGDLESEDGDGAAAPSRISDYVAQYNRKVATSPVGAAAPRLHGSPSWCAIASPVGRPTETAPQ